METACHFIRDHAEAGYPVSPSFFHYHAPTIFVFQPAKSEWDGMIISYLSPLDRQTAVIEAVVVHSQKRRQGIGTALLGHMYKYYQPMGVYHLKSHPGPGQETTRKLLEKQQFKEENGQCYTRHLLPERINLNNRRMRPRMNTINGEINEDTIFEYFQEEDIVWGVYSGGAVKHGVLLGRMAPNGDVNIQYIQLNTRNEVHTGTSHSATEFLNDGRIILYEDWEWTGNRKGGGRSVIEEIKTGTPG